MLNIVILMGRLTADPELKKTQTGLSVCSFCVAVERAFKSGTGARETDFINVVAWRKTADFVTQYFTKGKMILIEGAIQTRSYEDKNGNQRTAVEVLAGRVAFGESKPTGNSEPNLPAVSTGADFAECALDSSDLPF